MKPAIVLLTILVVGGAIVWLIDRLFYHTDKAENLDETGENDASGTTPAQGCNDEVCGIRSICPSEQILVSQCKREVIYYDDEELDSFAGREADGYTAEEEEQWRDVLYTLQPGDLLGWGQSIKHRGLVMPASIQAEFLQLAAENRR
ncbi:MAG: phospholipase [Muribaculaceae bacterium]|nr:phospholipase [Muribaculaceae bacterium]